MRHASATLLPPIGLGATKNVPSAHRPHATLRRRATAAVASSRTPAGELALILFEIEGGREAEGEREQTECESRARLMGICSDAHAERTREAC